MQFAQIHGTKKEIWVNTLTVTRFKLREGIHKTRCLIPACPTEIINNENWKKHTPQQKGDQKKLEQEKDTPPPQKKKEMEKKNKSDMLKKKGCLAAKWHEGRELSSPTKKHWHLRNAWLCGVNTVSSSDMSVV